MKKISIVTVSYNSEKYLEQTIQSVLMQNYTELEYIIIDGGSTDGTMNIINKYSDHIAKFISEQDKGMYYALKKGLNIASGEILGWLNSDDILLPGALMAIDKFFTQFKNIQWMTGVPVNTDESNILFPGYFKSSTLFKDYEYLNGNIYCLQQESTFFARSLYESVGGISTGYRLAGDYELWAKFFRKSELCLCEAHFAAFRKHENQLSAQKDVYLGEVARIREKYNTKYLKIKYFIYNLFCKTEKFLPTCLFNKIRTILECKKYKYNFRKKEFVLH